MSLTGIETTWTELKPFLDAGLKYRKVVHANKHGDYIIWTHDAGVNLFARLSDTTDKEDFDANYADNVSMAAAEVRQILDTNISSIFEVSHNMGDQTSWWFGSEQSIDESLQGSGNIWQTANFPVIDAEHGKILGEDDLTETGTSLAIASPYVFKRDERVVAKWGGADMQANPPGSPPHFLKPVLLDYQSGLLTRVDGSPDTGEWSINYESGIVTTGDDWGTNAPTLSYHYAQSSEYEFWVVTNKDWYVSRAEVQTYDADVDSSTIMYDVFMDHPQLGSGTIVNRRVYKSTQNVMDACNGAPQMWTDNLGREWWVFPWDYAGTKSDNEDARIRLQSALNMRVRLSMVNDKPYSPLPGKERAYVSVTMYGVSKAI